MNRSDARDFWLDEASHAWTDITKAWAGEGRGGGSNRPCKRSGFRWEALRLDKGAWLPWSRYDLDKLAPQTHN